MGALIIWRLDLYRSSNWGTEDHMSSRGTSFAIGTRSRKGLVLFWIALSSGRWHCNTCRRWRRCPSRLRADSRPTPSRVSRSMATCCRATPSSNPGSVPAALIGYSPRWPTAMAPGRRAPGTTTWCRCPAPTRRQPSSSPTRPTRATTAPMVAATRKTTPATGSTSTAPARTPRPTSSTSWRPRGPTAPGPARSPISAPSASSTTGRWSSTSSSTRSPSSSSRSARPSRTAPTATCSSRSNTPTAAATRS